jgi:hypothetical protein
MAAACAQFRHQVDERWPDLRVGDLAGALAFAEALALEPKGRG